MQSPRHTETIPEAVPDARRRCCPPSTIGEGDSPDPKGKKRDDQDRQKQPPLFVNSSTHHDIDIQSECSSRLPCVSKYVHVVIVEESPVRQESARKRNSLAFIL